MPERIRATYLVETAYPLAEAAAILAGEQSTGTFVRIPRETEALRARHGARVESVDGLEPVERPTLPGAIRRRSGAASDAGRPFRRARVVVSFPIENMGPSLPNILTATMGNLYELREFSGVRLLDIDFPAAFADVYPGPQFGVVGTRRLTGVEGRPLIGTIVKPSVGLSPAETADLVGEFAEAGVDFVKDDELQANGPHCPLDERVRAVMRVVNDHAERTGRKVMYAFNITDELDAMVRHHDLVAEAGGTCVMVNLNHVGVAAVGYLRRRCALPIHGHRAGWGALTRSPLLGLDFLAYQKIWRLVGVDHLHVCGLRNKFWETDDSVVRNARACLTPLLGG
ncbi:MAG: RuBisCO large subunit C-terminal-like domain-containing protein, partial [Candidatus Limnocylindria bacterium]